MGAMVFARTEHRAGRDPQGVEMSRKYSAILERLISDIAQGRLAVGTRLPAEPQLGQQFGASRGTVREAVRALAERGLVDVQPGRGATVNPESDWNVLDASVLQAIIAGPGKVGVLREFLECRQALEVSAAQLAATRATAEDLLALGSALAQLEAAAHRAQADPGAEAGVHLADVAFHSVLLTSAHNRLLSRIVAPIAQALPIARMPLGRPAERFRRGLVEHREILAAVASGNAAAAGEAMRRHLGTVDRYLDELRERLGVTADSVQTGR